MDRNEIDKHQYKGIAIGIWIGYIICAVINGQVFADITSMESVDRATLSFIIAMGVSVYFGRKY
jgi:putative Ca2+/H+ antiporter (TMEM165/GDT1 family)